MESNYSRIVKYHKANGQDCVQARFKIHHSELIVAKSLKIQLYYTINLFFSICSKLSCLALLALTAFLP